MEEILTLLNLFMIKYPVIKYITGLFLFLLLFMRVLCYINNNIILSLDFKYNNLKKYINTVFMAGEYLIMNITSYELLTGVITDIPSIRLICTSGSIVLSGVFNFLWRD